ncbi:MAG: Uma2 family endonuclease [Aggregatilineales bacterium]
MAMNAIAQQQIEETPDAMSMDDFIQAYGDAPFELINGEKIIMPAQISRSGITAGNLYFHLRSYLNTQKQSLGMTFIETPFVITYEQSSWVRDSRTPDVMFYSAAKMQAVQEDPDWQAKPMVGAADFVAEVISPTDTHIKVNEKCLRYLEDGVSLLWIIVPDTKTVTVYTAEPPNNPAIYTKPDDTLPGNLILPDFSLSLAILFT